jgi:hypothetical protein
MHSNPFPSSQHRASRPLELIHSDLHGPLPVCTYSGYRYWITFIDDYSQFRAVILAREVQSAVPREDKWYQVYILGTTADTIC